MPGRRTDEQGELIKGNTPTLLLAVLAEAPRHGYAIAREIERRSAESLKMGEGALYPALRTLEADGWIESRWETSESGPARKVYAITETGRKELTRRVAAWKRFSSGVDAVLGDLPGGKLPETQPG
jgi:PadR family transcriptional regulator, regulatory protein PadR